MVNNIGDWKFWLNLVVSSLVDWLIGVDMWLEGVWRFCEICDFL